MTKWLAVVTAIAGCETGEPDYVAIEGVEATDRYSGQRRKLVEQLQRQGIRSLVVLDAMMVVPRHEFIPDRFRSHAYRIQPLPIGHGQTISSPYIVAYMSEAAEITPGEKVLEIGTGSGYQAAVLAKLTDAVYTVEIVPELADGARSVLRRLGYDKVSVRAGNGYLGWPSQAPFDAIVVTAAPVEVPQALVDQLAENGKMVIPVGARGRQEMMIIERTETGVVQRRTLAVRFVPMVRKSEE